MTPRVRVLLIAGLAIVVIVGVALGFLLVYQVRKEELAEDRCLDRGGRWNAEQGVREYLPRPGEGANP